MNIVINNHETTAIYVDKANNHIANSDEIIRFMCCAYKSPIDKYIAIISGGLYFNKTEVAVLKHLIYNNGTELSGQICVAVAKEINKSTTTVARAIATLRNEKLIYGDGDKAVKLSASIATSIEALSKAKFFVIEVNPEVTSPKIKL